MPWNDNANPGPWGSPQPGQDPSRRPPEADGPNSGRGRRPPSPPTPGELPPWMRDLYDRLRQIYDGGSGGSRRALFATGAGVLLFLWFASGVYVVRANEVGVVSTLGAYTRTVGPGLHVRGPSPIEDVTMVPVTSLQQMDIGGEANDAAEATLMLTGDENIVDLRFAVQYRVSNAANYLFNVRDPRAAIQAVAESAMREVVGRTPLTPILTTGKGAVQRQTLELMQRLLDNYGAGVTVVEVQIKTANPPAPVVPAYQSLAQAGQEAQSLINQGNTYRNQVTNEARGDAAQIVQDATGYRERVVREAQGQASRFDQLFIEYRRNPTVTRQRIYIETMERILSRVHMVVIDSQGATAPIILPPDAFRARPEVVVTPPAATTAAPTATAPAGATQ